MDTNGFREQLSDYVENRLSAADRAAVDAHLLGSADARAELAALRAVLRDLGEWGAAPAPDAPMFFRDNVLSAVERTGTRRGGWLGEKSPSLLERWFPNAGRLALAAGFGGIAAVGGFLLANGRTANQTSGAPIVGTVLPPTARLPNVLPYAGEVAASDPADAAPRFVISAGRTLTPDAHPVCDLTFWLENATQGSARFALAGSGAPEPLKSVALTAHGAQTLRVPLDGIAAPGSLAVSVHWTAVGSAHDRFVFVPVGASSVSVGANPAAFTLAEMPLVSALKEMTARTGVPATLDDVPNAANLRVTLSANGTESASVALRRALAPLHLTVSRSPGGVLVSAAKP